MASTTRPPAGDDDNPVSEPGTRPPVEDTSLEIPHDDRSSELPTGQAFALMPRERVWFKVVLPDGTEIGGGADTVQGSSINGAGAHMIVCASAAGIASTPIGIGYLAEAPMQPCIIVGGVLGFLSLTSYYVPRALKAIRARKADREKRNQELNNPGSRSE